LENSLFLAINSLFRAKQRIQHNPLIGNDEKGLTGIETSSKQGNIRKFLLSGNCVAPRPGANLRVAVGMAECAPCWRASAAFAHPTSV
jgi:hypothetical protein